ncbi:alpha-hemoglobin-stabilizing protein [Perognathus longimembris pacificus]|uniref:alpha-hemoglobin-stabilizing protein n=1 Tax=Perognathus longimembris pacificus TaxID=214514 RepID=UPI0020194ECD|nr:alpha-hemoglobin-stabilizing protein [Perognathus longimembris pacificus]XP_048188916.1 alpha-hemoglobin-stabilizing protein [Perognathus longimembris pacificus]
MTLLPANKDIISKGMKEFNVLLNQQVFEDPFVSEEDMAKVVNDWVSLYINYYSKHTVGEPQEQDTALKELRQELMSLASPFLEKYKAFLKSQEHPNQASSSSSPENP